MLKDEKQRKQKALIDKINDLSKTLNESPEVVRLTALAFKDIYSSEFRHSYSEFFPLILQINKSDDDRDLDYLASNLETIRSYVENDFLTGKNEFEAMYKCFDKLCDHLNLEISRVRFSSQNEELTNDLSKKLELSQKEMRSSAEAISEATRKAEKIQIDLISVLSVFSAIVIAFSGSINILGNAISGIQNTYICKMLLALLICGFVLFNTIFLLLYMIGKIIDKSVLVECDSIKCDCKIGNKPKCNSFTKIYKRFPYVFYFNLLTIGLMVADIIFWSIDRFYIG